MKFKRSNNKLIRRSFQLRMIAKFVGVAALALVLLPVLFGMGVLLTHRIAGPIFRFETYLKTLSRSEHTGPCRTRDGDELDSLRDVINEVAAHVDALERRGEPSEAKQAA